MINNNDIAVISMSGRFPKYDDINSFWNMLLKNESSIYDISESSLRKNNLEEYLKHPNYVNKCSIINHPELFDADFFHMSRSEALLCDPQHRLFLQCCFEAINLAGHPHPEEEGIRTGVFAGCSINTYFILNLLSSDDIMRRSQTELVMNATNDFLTTRVAYKLNFKGPAVTVQTACSTSLVAVHEACQSLLSGEIDLALAGGSTVSAFREQGYFYTPDGIRSSDGLCRPFDNKGDGTIFGDGVGVVALCRVGDAIKHNNLIYAVIKSSAVNNDGSDKSGFTTPSISGQVEVIEEAMALAEVNPEDMTFVEAHGTATKIGDPIEFKALSKAFDTNKKQYCALGSVKSNVGHLDCASGVTGLIKAVLALYYRKLPATLHYNEPNKEIDLINSPFYICNNNLELKNQILYAGVSSLGIGGTNAHVIISNYPENDKKYFKDNNISSNEELYVYVWSDRTYDNLIKLIENSITYMEAENKFDARDIAYSLYRKYHHEYRSYFITHSKDIVPNIDDLKIYNILDKTHLVFLISDQGDNIDDLLISFYLKNEKFRLNTDNLIGILFRYYSHDLENLTYDNYKNSIHEFLKIEKIKSLKLNLFILISGIYKIYESFGVIPNLLMGDNFGEILSAYIAKAISEKEYFLLVINREKVVVETDLIEWKNILDIIEFKPTQIPILSNNTGKILAKGYIYTSDYWIRQLKSTMLIEENIKNIYEEFKSINIEPIFLEISPNYILSDLIEKNIESVKIIEGLYSRNNIDLLSIYDTLLNLWSYGLLINLDKIITKSRIIVPVPIAKLNPKPYWIYPKSNQEKNSNRSIDDNIINEQKSVIVKKENILEQMLKIFRKILMHEEFSVQDNFFIFGGDSISAQEISMQLRQYDIMVTPNDIYEFKTIDSIYNNLLTKNNNTATNEILEEDSLEESHDQEELAAILNQLDLD